MDHRIIAFAARIEEQEERYMCENMPPKSEWLATLHGTLFLQAIEIKFNFDSVMVRKHLDELWDACFIPV